MRRLPGGDHYFIFMVMSPVYFKKTKKIILHVSNLCSSVVVNCAKVYGRRTYVDIFMLKCENKYLLSQCHALEVALLPDLLLVRLEGTW